MDQDGLSVRVKSVEPSATLAISQRAREMRAEGRDVISLSSGEPDFAAPKHIIDAVVQAIRKGVDKYTAVDGTPELKAAIRAKFRRDNGLDFEDAEIAAAPGGKAILFHLFAASLDPGDEVIIPAPYWVSYPAMVRLSGGVAKIVDTKAENGFRLDPDALAAAITDKTAWVILNSPSNPTGAAYGEAALGELAQVLRGHPRVRVVSDDIYEHLLYEGVFATLAAVAPDLKDRIVTVNGASKAYAMTGWRIGYCAGPKPLVRAVVKLLSQSVSNPCAAAQAAAAAALDGPHDFLDDWRMAYVGRRDRVVASLNACKGLSVRPPEGAFYVFADCGGLIGHRAPGGAAMTSDIEVCAALLEAESVALVPGAAFGAPGHFRLSYAASDKEIDEACVRIARFCAKSGA